ncbi:reverse transcriptase domain-containing protein [Tanacetum coccineum]
MKRRRLSIPLMGYIAIPKCPSVTRTFGHVPATGGQETELLRDIEEMFRMLRKINIKLNLKKSTFGAVEGMFMGYMIGPEGIKPCPDKIEAVLQLPSPRTINEVQSLNGKLAGLNSDRCGLNDREGYDSDASLFRKSLIARSRAKLHPYGKAHPGTGLRCQEATKIFPSPSYCRENNITYRSWISVKRQILADFLVEKPDEVPAVASVKEAPQEPWTLFMDGLSCVDGSGAGLILTSPEGTKFTYTLRRDSLLALVLEAMAKSFYKWGIDIAGPFLEGLGKVKFLIVAMDYFTKWIEAKAVATISGSQVKKFVWDNIHFTSVNNPQSNRLVERANRSLGKGIKAHLGKGNTDWLEELPYVLWSHRTMIKSSNGDTLFSLTYRIEAVIPAEIGMPTYRTVVVDVVHNDEELRLNLDLLEERRERAAIRKAKAKSNMTKYYNARVRGVTFRPEDFVYHSNDASHAADEGKLGPK